MSRFQKWLLRIFPKSFEGEGERSTHLEWTVHVYSDNFSNNDDALPFI